MHCKFNWITVNFDKTRHNLIGLSCLWCLIEVSWSILQGCQTPTAIIKVFDTKSIVFRFSVQLWSTISGLWILSMDLGPIKRHFGFCWEGNKVNNSSQKVKKLKFNSTKFSDFLIEEGRKVFPNLNEFVVETFNFFQNTKKINSKLISGKISFSRNLFYHNF